MEHIFIEGASLTSDALQRLKQRRIALGFFLLCALSAVELCLAAAFGVVWATPEYAYSTGEDVLGVLVCTMLYYACFKGWDNADESTRLFTSMLFCDACMLFFDHISVLVEGVPELRVVNTVSGVLYMTGTALLSYQFWRYVFAYLSLEGTLARRCHLVMRILLPPALLVCLANLFVPLCFYVDEQGVYHETDWFFLGYSYVPVLAVCAMLCLLRARAPLSDKVVIAFFFSYPTVYAIVYAVVNPESSDDAMLPDGILLSIILMYAVLVSNRAKKLASTMSELKMAAQFQRQILPDIFPAFPQYKEFDIYATMTPAKEVGGDFFDFFLMDSDHLALVAADVSGKGVPAAMFMMTARTVIKTKAQSDPTLSPKELLMESNAALSENNREGMFVTVWLGILEISTGKLTCADAGHEKLLLYRDGVWRFLPKKACGPALALWDPDDFELVDEQYQYCNDTLILKPGDALFQYTDGVTEATDADCELFGEERLLGAMNSAPSADPAELLSHVRQEIEAFVNGAPQFDDITMLALRYNGKSASDA